MLTIIVPGAEFNRGFPALYVLFYFHLHLSYIEL